jgi:uncharacterized RDD family membrane protein YckC
VTAPEPPSLPKRLLCVLYDGLLILALLLVASFPFVALTQNLDTRVTRPLLQIYLLLVTGTYFTFFWRKGQTLAMKTWRFRMETNQGSTPEWGRLWLRYALACLNLTLMGVGWWWALFHADRQFLQDRLAKTRLVNTPD